MKNNFVRLGRSHASSDRPELVDGRFRQAVSLSENSAPSAFLPLPLRHVERWKRGFTLVEVIVASITLSVFLVGSYKIYRGVTNSFQRTNWSLKTQNYSRNGLNFMREEMQRASYRSTVSIDSVNVDVNNYKFHVVSAGPKTAGKLAEWYIGIPFKGGSSGAVFKSTLTLQNKTITYTKSKVEGTMPANEREFAGKVVLENVESFEVDLEPLDIGLAVPGQLVIMKVEMKHPKPTLFPGLKVNSQTGAKVEVEVVRDL